jgi:hypothetical protein
MAQQHGPLHRVLGEPFLQPAVDDPLDLIFVSLFQTVLPQRGASSDVAGSKSALEAGCGEAVFRPGGCRMSVVSAGML